MEKRVLSIGLIFLLISVILIARIAQIQLIHTESFTKHNINLIEESVKQRTQNFILHKGRGYFTDRHGVALNHSYQIGLILFPFLKDLSWPVNEIAEIIGVDPRQIESRITNEKEPFVFSDGDFLQLTEHQMKKINELKIPGVYAQYLDTYQQEKVAEHLIGLTGENQAEVLKRYPEKVEKGLISKHAEIGVSGLERAFDPFLLSAGESKLSYHVDGKGNPLLGFEVKYTSPANPYYPTEVETTLDKEIQEIAEQVMNNYGITKGGVVLLDVKTSELLALVSRPRINVNDPFGAGGRNEMVTAHFPGSIFKVIIAAAAIENNIVEYNQQFNCDQNLYDDGEEKRHLGLLSFKESFSQSCNYTFALLAQQLMEKDRAVIETYAKRLGIGYHVGWEGTVYHLQSIKHFPEEEAGQIWLNEDEKYNDRSIAQTAIGQLNVQLSPLSIANMMATIARGGEKLKVRAARKVNYENGTTLVDFEKQQLVGDNLAPYTIMKLQELLNGVVQDEKGTAYTFLNGLPYTVAGKSGTAETIDKRTMNHWFAGYFPANKPKYAMVVVDLSRKEGEVKIYNAFKELVEKLYEFDNNHE
ncbi:peptidoglycan D,D-transpeptidase FtsI family protein [Anaerobacillus sp. MEB173]|uniref:peptidoglycan D,D-transpeptidase FtsI family protein n=1 Tax=Anaerobacillus sp. MEB173 TaxID=3383345 RepID=UPI003F8E2288